MNQLTIIVPAYNEEASLPALLEDILPYCQRQRYKLIIVNDGSSDNSKQLLDDIPHKDWLTIIHHKVNKGYGGAIKSAIVAADTPYLMTIDADGQHSIDDIERLYSYLTRTDADMVIGRRASGQDTTYRRIGKILIRGIAKMLMPIHIEDLNSGMKVYRSDFAKKYISLCPDSMAYSDIITLIFINQKHLVLEQDITVKHRKAGSSTINSRTALDTVLEILNIVILFNPNRIFFPLAVIFTVVGVAWGLPFLFRGEGVQASTVLLVISGLLFFLMGLLAEQLSLIRRGGID
ncbi:glycosyltransferase family 2 protein [Pseudomonadota bacterium]